MVFSLMLVIMLMIEARKAENWEWIWAMTRTPLPSETSSEEIDTRLPYESERASDPPGTVYASSQTTPAVPSTAELIGQADNFDDAEEARERIRRDAWREMLKQLDRDDTRVVSRVLRHSRGGPPLTVDDRKIWSGLQSDMDEQWQQYLTKANDAVLIAGDDLPAEQRTTLLNTLRDLEVEWSTLLNRALRAALEDRPWTELEREALAKLQATLDDLALAEVRDDMVARPQERTAWFRCFEKLQALSDTQLQSQSVGEVGFVQLFRQTNEYRGKLVKVSGTAEWAYQVIAPNNDLGIEHYYIFWVRPADGSDSPIVAYALDLPAGFPNVGNDRTKLSERVSFTGFFFKRWAYGAQDGIRTAPQVLANVPEWHPEPELLSRKRPSLSVIGIVMLAIALLAIRIAIWVYRAGDSKPVATRSRKSEPSPKQFAAMAEAKIGPTLNERLQERSQRDQQDESP